MLDKIEFLLINIILPISLSILYSNRQKKNQLFFDLTKGTWYLLYGGTVAYDYLFQGQSRRMAGLTITIAIMEGLPLLLKNMFNKNEKNDK